MKAFSVKGILVVAILAVAMVAIVGCGGDNNDGGSTPATTTAPAGTEAPPAPTVAPGDDNDSNDVTPDEPSVFRLHEPRDLGGRAIRVGGWWENTIPFTDVSEEPDPATSDNYWEARMTWNNAMRVFEEFNFTLDEIIIDYSYLLEALTSSVMAGDAFSDIMMLSGAWLLPAVVGDLIQPLDSINLPGSDLLGSQIYATVLTEILGERWTFNDSRPDVGGMAMGVNLDIINAIGVPNPVDLYNSGQWTWDAMLQIMRTATADTTGDGIIDRFGLAGQPGDITTYMVGANDGRMVDDDFNYWLDHPNTIEALEFMETIMREGLWQHDQTHGFDVGNWAENFWAFQDGNAALFVATTWAVNADDLPFNFAIVPFPTGPSNTSGTTWFAGFRQGLAFPHASNWDAADILMVVEEFYSWSGDDVSIMHEGALAWPRTRFLTEEDVQRKASVSRTVGSDIGMVVPQFQWIFGTFLTHFADESMTVQQAIETYRGPQQELLDNFFN